MIVWRLCVAQRIVARCKPKSRHAQTHPHHFRAVPRDFDEAKAFLFGEPLEFRKIEV
jgi:hypothetical protein